MNPTTIPVGNVTFAPTVVLDGRVVTPAGWMWVFALAMNGVPWAVELCDDPVYDMRGKIRAHLNECEAHEIEQRLAYCEAEMKRLKARQQELRK